jgi:hypothetical protein
MLPAVTPVGATVVMEVAVTEEEALTPLNLMVVAPVKPVPVMTIEVPADKAVAETEVTEIAETV